MARASLPGDVIAALGARIAEHAGLEPPAWVLEARMLERVTALGLDTPDAYVALIGSPRGVRELDLLLESLRVGETRFFRHRAHVDTLSHTVIPALTARAGRRHVRAWSAGCATGEEAYTLAMVLRKHLPAPRWTVSVLASDISAEALAIAERGEYPSAALDHVPEAWRRWFAEAPDGRVRVDREIASRVRFERRNLAEGRFPTGFDVIWCRNVLIYFTPEARERTVAALAHSLADGGFLVVGYAESLRDFAQFEAVRTPDSVIYRKAASGAAPESAAAAQDSGRAVGVPDSGRTAAVQDSGRTDAVRSRERVSAARGAKRTAAVQSHTPATAPADPAIQPEEAVIALRGDYADGARLTRELADALSGAYRRVTVDLDGAHYLGDAAAAVLRRAAQGARDAGIELFLAVTRPGPERWLRRHGLDKMSEIRTLQDIESDIAGARPAQEREP